MATDCAPRKALDLPNDIHLTLTGACNLRRRIRRRRSRHPGVARSGNASGGDPRRVPPVVRGEESRAARILGLETARLLLADRACSVGINADILERFRRERLFWTLNHPRSHPLNELTVRLLDRSGLVARADRAGTVRTIEVAFTSPEPSANIQVPVHPDVAAVLGLTWYRPSQRCCCFGLKSASYADYWNAYIHYTFTPPAFAERRVA